MPEDAGVGASPSSDSFAAELNDTFSETPSTTAPSDQSGDPGFQQQTDATPPERITQAPDFTDPAELAQPEPEEKPKLELGDDLDDIGDPKIVDFKGKKEWHFTPEKGARLIENHKFVQELREAIPGLTVEDAKAHYQSDTHLKELWNDFLNGGTDRLAATMAQVSQNNRNPEAFANLAFSAALTLKNQNPQAFRQMIEKPITDGHMARYMDRVQDTGLQELQQARESGDQAKFNQAAYKLWAVQQQAYEATGKYKTEDGYRGKTQQAPPEMSQREMAQEQELQQHRQAAQQRQQQAVQHWEKTFNTDRDSRVQSVITSGLEKIKDYIPGTPTQQAAWKTHISSLVTGKLEGDPSFVSRFNLDRAAAMRSGDEARRGAVLAQWENRAKGIVNGELRKLIAEHTASQLDQNGKAHSARKAADARREPGGGLTPVPKSIVVPPQNGSKVDFKRELDEAFANM